jgi:hypothetical protein
VALRAPSGVGHRGERHHDDVPSARDINVNVLVIPLEDIATLDRHLGGRVRKLLYEIVAQRLTPTIDGARERAGARSRWFLILRGEDQHGRPQVEEKFEIECGDRFDLAIGVITKLHIESYLREIQREFALVYRDEFAPSDVEPEVTVAPPTRRRDQPS